MCTSHSGKVCYQILNGNTSAGNKIVHQVMNRTVVAVFTFQITMVGMLGLKVFAYGTFMLFMALVTIIFRMFVARRYVKAFRFLALRECPERHDIEDPPENEDSFQESFLSYSTKTAGNTAGTSSRNWDRKKFRRYFSHPALKPPPSPETESKFMWCIEITCIRRPARFTASGA